MINSRFFWAILLVLAAMLGGAWVVLSQEDMTAVQSPITLTEAPIVGHRAPDFTLQTAVGESITLSELIAANGATGQPVVLNFWASWCAPCRVEMPELQQASRDYNGRAVIIGVNQGESQATVSDFGRSENISYPLLVDDQSEVSRLYNVSSLPTTIFIDGQGVVQEVTIGILTRAVLQDRIEALLTP